MTSTPKHDVRFKKIEDYSSEELDWAIGEAVGHCKNPPTQAFGDEGWHVAKLDFWTILRGVDAYQEKRRRKHGLGAANNLELTERIEILERRNV